MTVDTTRTLVRRLGEVEVIVHLPLDMPDPTIALMVHTATTTAAQRGVAIDAFGMTEEQFKKSNGHQWFEVETGYGAGHLNATVFVEPPEAIREEDSD